MPNRWPACSRAGRDAPSLVGELRRSFRTVAAGAGVTLAITIVLIWVLLAHTHPDIARLTELTRELRLSHEGMLEQQTGLRAWLMTGERTYLADAEEGRAQATAAEARVLDLVDDDGTLIRQLVDLRVAQERWHSSWAEVAAQHDADAPAELGRFLAAGHRDFGTYREAHRAAVARAASSRDHAVDRERNVLAAGILGEAVICCGLLGAARRRRGEVERSVVAPLEELVETMHRVGAGDLTARAAVDGPRELRLVAEGLSEMTVALAEQHALVVRREAEAVDSAQRLREILVLARDIAGSLSVRYVAESVAAAAARVGDAGRVVVWLHEGTGTTLEAVHDTAPPPAGAPPRPPAVLGTGVVGLAARDGRRVAGREEGSPVTALPMVVGARVIGVIELVGEVADDERAREALEALAVHAGASLEAARLHRRTEELSQSDALTGLLNRRRLEADLTAECEHSRRYGSPLSFVMLDVDHFKAFNDAHGHQHGDQVLQAVAAVLRDTIRSSDSVYRYGGEELAVLVRENPVTAAARLAERLRARVEQVLGATVGPVTASFGVAEVGHDCDTPELLVAAADEALYAAKAAGRNRVVVADQPGRRPVPGPVADQPGRRPVPGPVADAPGRPALGAGAVVG
jgi:diguanylate cyclase (GGDEF)-like protein